MKADRNIDRETALDGRTQFARLSSSKENKERKKTNQERGAGMRGQRVGQHRCCDVREGGEKGEKDN